MPLIGLAAGSSLARVIGPAASYIAAGAVIALGTWSLPTGMTTRPLAGRIAACTAWQ